MDDWAAFFDHDAFVGTPEQAGCYCREPHVAVQDAFVEADVPPWGHNLEAMLQRLRDANAFGYLACVDERPAGWVNASLRADHTLRPTEDQDPPGTQVVGICCFIIAPPNRRHGLAAALLNRVLADAAERGAGWVEAYPFTEDREGDGGNFRSPLGPTPRSHDCLVRWGIGARPAHTLSGYRVLHRRGRSGRCSHDEISLPLNLPLPATR